MQIGIDSFVAIFPDPITGVALSPATGRPDGVMGEAGWGHGLNLDWGLS